jgi:hypothetical protein
VSHFRSLLAKHPLRVALLVTIVVAMVATSAFAYLLSPRYAGGPRASTVSPPLEFAIELDKDEFQLGENVTVRLSMKNIGNNTITLFWPNHYGGVLDFLITAENGTYVYQLTDNTGAWAAVKRITLDAGEDFVNTFVWEQNYYSASANRYFAVLAGNYFMKGLSRVFELTAEGQTIKGMTLETPTVAFIIT